MATTNDATINGFYLAYYGRPADPAGLAYWSDALAKSNGDFSSIINAFATSAEATAHIGTGTASDQIGTIYQQVFGHAPDAAGLAYWTAAISSGNMTLADAAIQITNGAQSSDLTVSTLRQDVAAQFTASVSASGVAYDGDAAVAAGRVLIAAVNANSSAADIKALITAGASLVQTAHDNPAILTAMANGSDLTTLLSTASGKADPVALLQALASIGKAALNDSAGLTTLLHGDGVAGLLASLPAGTTIKDLVTAVDDGGLAAGTTVATTPVDTTPVDTTAPAAPKVQLVVDSGISPSDHITNNDTISITGIEKGGTWEYSRDGVTWHTGPTAVDGAATLKLGVGGATTLDVRTHDAAGNVSATTELKYTYEQSPSSLTYVTGHYSSEVTTNNSGLTFSTTLAQAHPNDETIVYQVSTTNLDGSFTTWTPGLNLLDGTYYFRASVSDPAGNTATGNVITVHLDNSAPPTPTAHLNVDTGIDGDGLTTNGAFTVSGLVAGDTWQYTGDGVHWYTGTPADAEGMSTGYLFNDGAQTVQVVAIDAAGNKSGVASFDVTLDRHNPMDGMTIDHLSYDNEGGDGTTLAHADVVLSYTDTINPGDVLKYNLFNDQDPDWVSIDSSMIDTDAKTITIHDIDLSKGDPYITVNFTDPAGGNYYYQQTINGPVTAYGVVQPTAASLQMYTANNAHFYLTDSNAHSVELTTTLPDPTSALPYGFLIGAQATVVQGVLGSGETADTQTVNNSEPFFGEGKTGTLGFGTTGNDAITGSHVWGFDGDDTITLVASADYYSSTVYGGLGSDQIHMEATSGESFYDSAAESSVAAGATAAHGFDTVYLGTDGAQLINATLNFEHVKLAASFFQVSASGYTGVETGDALLALLNTAATGHLTADKTQQGGIINVGDGVGFVVVDANGDGAIDSTDYVVKIVGISDTASGSFSLDSGYITVHSNSAF